MKCAAYVEKAQHGYIINYMMKQDPNPPCIVRHLRGFATWQSRASQRLPHQLL